jgi:hypothetical protein
MKPVDARQWWARRRRRPFSRTDRQAEIQNLRQTVGRHHHVGFLMSPWTTPCVSPRQRVGNLHRVMDRGLEWQTDPSGMIDERSRDMLHDDERLVADATQAWTCRWTVVQRRRRPRFVKERTARRESGSSSPALIATRRPGSLSCAR